MLKRRLQKARLSLHLSKRHLVGNHMSWLIFLIRYFVSTAICNSKVYMVRKPICDIVFCAMTFWFRRFNFLLSYFDFLVLCSVYDVVVLNGTIHEVETRYRRKDGRKRSCKYFNAVIVHVMLVFFFFCIWNPCSWFYHKVKNVQGMLQSGFSLCESIQIDPGQLNTRQFSPL